LKYELDYGDDINESIVFWITNFIKFKLTSLSNTKVTDQVALSIIIKELKENCFDIDTLLLLTKRARKIGMNGINTYTSPLIKFHEYFTQLYLKSMKEFDEDLLSDFLSVKTAGLSDSSKKNYRIALLSFFSYIDKRNKLNESSSFRFNIELKNWGGLGGRSGVKNPAFLTEQEIHKFITSIDTCPFAKKSIERNRLIVKLLLFTGMRISEILSLKTKDLTIVDDEYYEIRIKGKGNKYRVAMIEKDKIRKQIHNFNEYKPLNCPLLVPNFKGNELSQSYVYRIVEKILLHAGIRKEKNGPHMLRHTFGSFLYKKKKDLVLVQEALGHEDIKTSRIYTHFEREKLKETTDIW